MHPFTPKNGSPGSGKRILCVELRSVSQGRWARRARGGGVSRAQKKPGIPPAVRPPAAPLIPRNAPPARGPRQGSNLRTSQTPDGITVLPASPTPPQRHKKKKKKMGSRIPTVHVPPLPRSVISSRPFLARSISTAVSSRRQLANGTNQPIRPLRISRLVLQRVSCRRS